MTRPRLLDLFCGAGGCSMGYHRAGFDVIGIDVSPQPNYPFPFIQADATRPPVDLAEFDAIHASPPCNDHSQLHRNYGSPEHGTGWMLHATIAMLRSSGRPWVVENVATAPLPSAIELCGASFRLGASGLDLSRHRRFELGGGFAVLAPPLPAPPRPHHRRLRQRHKQLAPPKARPEPPHSRDAGGDGHRLDDPGRTEPGHPTRLHRTHRPPTDRLPGAERRSVTNQKHETNPNSQRTTGTPSEHRAVLLALRKRCSSMLTLRKLDREHLASVAAQRDAVDWAVARIDSLEAEVYQLRYELELASVDASS